MAATTREVIFRQVLGNLNASAGDYEGALSLDEMYDDVAVMDAVLNTEAFLLHKIAESWFNGNRTNQGTSIAPDLIVETDVANGDLVPVHSGPVIGVKIDGLRAEICSAVEVDRLRVKNPLKLTLIGNLYGLEDNRFFFTSDTGAANAQVSFFQWLRPTFTNLADFKASKTAVPFEYQQAWVDLATGAVMPREGNMIQAGAFYTKRGEMVLAELERENRPRAMSKDSQMAGE